MLIAVPAEVHANESRVAATPETVKKLINLGHDILIQKGAGAAASITDAAFEESGARLAANAKDAYKKADIVLKVRGATAAEMKLMRKDAVQIGMLSPYDADTIAAYAKRGLSCFAMEWIPRISRAQAMDVLSSQANIGGYKAALLAANHYPQFFPMLMTAAGTVRAAKVLVMGAGVAGLQAIATAKRMGAVVEAFDVRPAAREQVESLGAKFVEVPSEETESAETAGGYAKEMSEDYKRKQSELVAKHAAKSDVIITTALIPGRPAPVLISEGIVKNMRAGSVIVDMAVEAGGNCPLSQKDEVVVKHDVTIIGHSNLPGMVAADASSLYARNIFNFLELLLDKESGQPNINVEDEIIAGALLCMGGKVVHPQLTDSGGAA
ncbi:MAG: Re/Si-specific NAD(P)(+) transhydrogenase subunit alpha [Mariprofundaceae bacterium]